MSKGMNPWALVFAIVVLSAIDVVFNVISFIPIIGDIGETMTEMILEFLTIMAAIALGVKR